MTDIVEDKAAVPGPTADEAGHQVLETPERPVSPRQQALEEIVKATEGQHEDDNKRFRETVVEVDDDGKSIVPPVEATPAETAVEDTPPVEEVTPPADQPPPAVTEDAFDPNREYELTVDGHKIRVLGSKILENGRRTIQKEAAADLRLQLASRILAEAKARADGGQMERPVDQPPTDRQPPTEAPDPATLAEAIQYGTKEQAAAAIAQLSKQRGERVTPDQIATFVRSQLRKEVAGELEFHEAAKFVESEYSDLMTNRHLKAMFFQEEDRLRREGDQRGYKDLYKAIGDDLRASFNLKKSEVPKAPSTPAQPRTMAERKDEKARTTPPVPRTAAARLDAPAGPKAPSHTEVLNQMRAARKQAPLN